MGYLAQAVQRAQLRISYGRERPAFTFCESSVLNAIAQMDLRAPVNVSMTDGRGGKSRGGMHRYANGEHSITVLRRYSAESASRTLWHELEHAAQVEHDFAGDARAFGRAYMAEWPGGKVPHRSSPEYQHNRFERAAKLRELEHDRLPLAR